MTEYIKLGQIGYYELDKHITGLTPVVTRLKS